MDCHYIILFANCIPVKGVNRSLICDLQKNNISIIPNELYDLTILFDSNSVDRLLVYYGLENRIIVQDYFNFLIESGYAFYCQEDEIENFPSLDIDQFDLPSLISNAIIEFDSVDGDNIMHVAKELDTVFCSAIEVRFTKKIEFADLENCISLFNGNDIRISEVHVVVTDNYFNLDDLKNLFVKNLKLTTITVTGSLKQCEISDFSYGNSHIFFTTLNSHQPICCGNFIPNSFTTNMYFFIESQHHNTCLNRKIAIDKDGNIKNCPSMQKTFGNIRDDKLLTIIKNEELTSKWNISKDEVKVCRDCEFRHVCMDCRAYVEDPHDIYSKPLKCGYNPYTMVWDEWSINPLKQAAVEYYGLQKLVKN